VTPTSAPSAGTWGKFQYCPGKNVFVGVNRTSENVYIYRLTSGAGTTAADKVSGRAEPALNVYPNPCSGGFLKIDLPCTDGKLSLTRADGRQLTALTNVPPGVYLLRYSAGDRLWQKRVVVLQ
jgi:hypothetical protein